MKRMRGFQEIKGRSNANLPPPRAVRLPVFLRPRVADPDQAMATLRLLQIGVGAVGADFVLKVARMQPRLLALVDPASVKPTTVLTGCAFFPEDCGAKVKVIGRRIKSLSPNTRVLIFRGKVQDLTLDVVMDLALDAVGLSGDNLSCELAAGQICQVIDVPLIHGAVSGPQMVAQVRVHSQSCPACNWGASERRALGEQVRYSCEGNPVGTAAVPTMSTPNLASLAGDLMLNQLLRLHLGLGDDVADTLIEYCGYTNRLVTTPLARNPECMGDHTRYRFLKTPQALAECTLAEVASLAAVNGAAWSVAVPGMRFVERVICRCNRFKTVARFVPMERLALGRCPRCGGEEKVHPQFVSEALPPAKTKELQNLPLRRLGIGSRTTSAIIRTEIAAFILRCGKEHA